MIRFLPFHAGIYSIILHPKTGFVNLKIFLYRCQQRLKIPFQLIRSRIRRDQDAVTLPKGHPLLCRAYLSFSFQYQQTGEGCPVRLPEDPLHELDRKSVV